MARYVFWFLLVCLIFAAALVAGLLAGGHVAEAMKKPNTPTHMSVVATPSATFAWLIAS